LATLSESNIIGRARERKELDRLLASKEAEFLALYGRRRVGKTFLVREHFKKQLCFELTGIKDAHVKEQLANFHQQLTEWSGKTQPLPDTWQVAFQQLADYLKSLRGSAKRVIFLDELPWLAGPRSGFLSALDHFWNAVASRDRRLVVVICGSAASWMIAKVIDHKGGLHNRVTARMRLEPFTLAEASQFLLSRGVKLTRYDQLMLAMVMGGVPHYLKEARPGESAVQIIDRVCFSPTGLLVGEFDRLYASLFENPERLVELVRMLAKHPQGVTRSALTKVYSTGGRLSSILRELEEAGFVRSHSAYEKITKDTIYRLADEFSLFSLKWMARGGVSRGGSFLTKFTTPAWRAWSGYALETLALKHSRQIKAALGIAGVETTECGWVHRPNKIWPDGVQIDLLIDRADHTIHLVEIKFSQGVFTINKDYAQELRRKVAVFQGVTGTRKNVFLTFLTVHGVAPNAYAKELVPVELTTDCLFVDVV
jgi:AAA+ ATPase superfamily predicted ATPase